MERIGIAASKIARGNLLLYNCFVILISSLFSMLVLVVAGSTVIFALVILRYVSQEIMAFEFDKTWKTVFLLCMISLTVMISLFNLLAIIKNIKLHKKNIG